MVLAGRLERKVAAVSGGQGLNRDREQDIGEQARVPGEPVLDWRAHWQQAGIPWRVEPEIPEQRQDLLRQRLSIQSDVEHGQYPFKGMRLSRADVEWLLAEHENGRGPVDWADPDQRCRDGLDLRGADLSGVDLASLPLARSRGGLTPDEYVPISGNHLWNSSQAAINLRGANLFKSHLEGSTLTWAHLEDASFDLAYLQKADLSDAYMAGTSLRRAHLSGANLRFCTFDERSNLNYAEMASIAEGCVSVGDTSWGGANLALIEWAAIGALGDEEAAYAAKCDTAKTPAGCLTAYRTAVRANRQLAVALLAQGASEESARFAYRANRLERNVLWYSRRYGRYAFNLMLDLLAGFGYRPVRTLMIYLITIAAFALIYAATTRASFPEALTFSVTSFHGRGIIGTQTSVSASSAQLSMVEGVLGLVVEAALVATFAQRFLGR
jgi:uncharacterized protein YjbI with pentapeptide repeats